MIQRFTCNMELLDECPHIEPLLKDAEGGYVRYADHAAELARVEGEREETRKAWCLLRSALNAIAWGKWDNNAFPRRVAQDALAIGCPVANDRAEKLAAESLEAANALLRAECEAVREFEAIDRDAYAPAQTAQEVAAWAGRHRVAKLKMTQARAATDAAGILKGAGT